MKVIRSLAFLAIGLLMGGELYATQEFVGDELTLNKYLVLPRVGRYGRVPIHIDPVQAMLVKDTWQAPQSDEEVSAHDGKLVKWSSVETNDEGWLEHGALRGGYAYAQVTSPRRQVVLLEATGHAMVFVNGEPRAGDPYLTGRTILPVRLNSGTNELLFHTAAGKLRVQLKKPPQDVFFDVRDVTKPTLIRGEGEPVWLGVLVVNCREQTLAGAQIISSSEGGMRVTSLADLVPPLGVRKISIPVMPPEWSNSPTGTNEVTAAISLSTQEKSAAPIEVEIQLKIAESNAPQTRTFRSAIDDSVQDYQLLPAKVSPGESPTEPGLLVTLHDSGESASEHLAKFTAQANVHLLAPGGRRAEGCDWEDWSARDALEAVDDAAKHLKFDKQRVWLHGTGAGGHGVLRLGGMAADRWAALVSRDPWLEYPAEPTDEVATRIDEMLERVAWSNRLTPLLRNTVICGLLLEQSDASSPGDSLQELFDAFHPHFESRIIEGSSDNANLAKVLEFCEKHTSADPAKVKEVDIATYDPGENATIHWLTIVNQREAGALSRAAVRFDAERTLFLGITVNVATLMIDTSHLEADTIVEVALDGEAVGEFAVEGQPLTFLRNEAGWQLVPTLPSSFKQPQRYGGMRSAFLNQPILVYGTRGTAEENAWALAKARYDAETILVRNNGSVDVVADTAFKANTNQDRSVVLYGNSDTNIAWPQLMSTSPVQVRRDGVWIDRRPEQGAELACVFVRPRQGNDVATVGVVSGTDLGGMRATDRLPFFVNGTNFPDLLLFKADSLQNGNRDVNAAGYFGRVWTVDPGEIVWRDAAL